VVAFIWDARTAAGARSSRHYSEDYVRADV